MSSKNIQYKNYFILEGALNESLKIIYNKFYKLSIAQECINVLCGVVVLYFSWRFLWNFIKHNAGSSKTWTGSLREFIFTNKFTYIDAIFFLFLFIFFINNIIFNSIKFKSYLFVNLPSPFKENLNILISVYNISDKDCIMKVKNKTRSQCNIDLPPFYNIDIPNQEKQSVLMKKIHIICSFLAKKEYIYIDNYRIFIDYLNIGKINNEDMKKIINIKNINAEYTLTRNTYGELILKSKDVIIYLQV
jgi:hypothetical protein